MPSDDKFLKNNFETPARTHVSLFYQAHDVICHSASSSHNVPVLRSIKLTFITSVTSKAAPTTERQERRSSIAINFKVLCAVESCHVRRALSEVVKAVGKFNQHEMCGVKTRVDGNRKDSLAVASKPARSCFSRVYLGIRKHCSRRFMS